MHSGVINYFSIVGFLKVFIRGYSRFSGRPWKNGRYSPQCSQRGGVKMAVLRIFLMCILILVSIVFTVIVLMQEGKSAGLGAISGAAETYWGKNKGRSMEGALVKFTKILGIVFMLLAIVLNINF